MKYAEQRGFDAVWQAESRLVREATVPMAAFASVTERIKVGSGVVDCWSRNPARLAATFSTLDDLAPGRVILGIGAWWDPLAKKVGIDRARPLTVMREIVTVVRALLHNENVTFDGTTDGALGETVNMPMVKRTVSASSHIAVCSASTIATAATSASLRSAREIGRAHV